jgi:putative transposase
MPTTVRPTTTPYQEPSAGIWDHPQAQQARCDRFCRKDNTERPHEALAQRMPAAMHRPATRPMPTNLPQPAYPGHYLGRRVRHAGTVRCRTRPLCMSDTLLQQDSALEETGDGLWSISCYACPTGPTR